MLQSKPDDGFDSDSVSDSAVDFFHLFKDAVSSLSKAVCGTGSWRWYWWSMSDS